MKNYEPIKPRPLTPFETRKEVQMLFLNRSETSFWPRSKAMIEFVFLVEKISNDVKLNCLNLINEQASKP